MLLELLIAQQGEKAKHTSSLGGSIISWWNMCDSSEPGGSCPDANLESSYYCIWERESAENSLWGEKQNRTKQKKPLIWQKKKKKKKSLQSVQSVITFRYLIYHLPPWNLLCPLLPLPWQREGGQTFSRKDRAPVADRELPPTSEEGEWSWCPIPFNHAVASVFCKSVHSYGNWVNRKLTFGAKTRGILKLSK